MASTSTHATSSPIGRELEFPADRAIGTIEFRSTMTKYETNWEQAWKGWADKREARGVVTVPAGQEAKLTINLGQAGSLACLRQLPAGVVTSVALSGGKISDADWECVLQMPAFARLSLSNVEMSDMAVARIDRLISLTHIEANTLKFGNAMVSAVANLPRLVSLRIYGGGLTDAGMSRLGKATGLKDLALASDDITAMGFAHLATLTQLEELSAWGLPPIGDAGLAALAGMTRLRVLVLMKAGVTNAGMVHLAGLKELRELRLDQNSIDGEGIAHLAGLPKLESLTLPHMSDDACLHRVAAIRSLRKLHVGATKATDAGVAALTALTDLEELNIGGEKITDAGAAEIAKFTKLKMLWLQNCPVTDAGFAKVAANANLERVLISNLKITDASLALLSRLPRLSDLAIYSPREAKMRLEPLAGCTGLTSLSLDGTLAGDDELAHLRGMTKLESLSGGLGFGDAGAEHIASLASLKRLSAWNTKLTDVGLTRIGRLTNLETLQVGGSITDEGLQSLTNLRKLTYLNLNTRTTTPEGRAALQARLPALASINVPPGPPPSAMPKVGDAAPPIDTVLLDGKPWRLADQRGKVVLVYFWATWCSPCVASQPGMRDHFAELRKHDRFAMVSLSMDYQEFTLRRFVEMTPLPWPQAFIGMNSPIAAAWGTTGSAPHYFLVGPDGKILSTSRDWNELTSMTRAALAAAATQPTH